MISVSISIDDEFVWLLSSSVIVIVRNNGIYVSVKLVFVLNFCDVLLLKIMSVMVVSSMNVMMLSIRLKCLWLFEWCV